MNGGLKPGAALHEGVSGGWLSRAPPAGRGCSDQLSAHFKSPVWDGCRADGWLLFPFSSGELCVSGVPLLSKSDSHLVI